MKDMLNHFFDDVDGKESRYLDAIKLKKVITQCRLILGDPIPSDEEVNEVFKGLDLDRSGRIGKEEFEPFVREFNEQWYAKLTQPGSQINSKDLKEALKDSTND